MKSEYRGIFAVVLSAIVMVIWFKLSPPPKTAAPTTMATQTEQVVGQEKLEAVKTPETKDEKISTGSSSDKNPGQLANKKTVEDPQADLPVKTWVIKNSLVEVELSTDGGVPISWKTILYHKGTESNSPVIDLVSGIENNEPALGLSFEGANFAFPVNPRYKLLAADEEKVVFGWQSKEVFVQKTISLSKDSYVADVSVEIKPMGKEPVSGKTRLLWSSLMQPVKKSGGPFGFLMPQDSDAKTPLYYIDGAVERQTNLTKVGASTERAGNLLWAGVENRYFLGAIIPRVQGEGLSVIYGENEPTDAPKGTYVLWAGAGLPKITALVGDSAKATFSVYAGPKEINNLKAVGVKLEEAIDYGWFGLVAKPILYLLQLFNSFVKNYGIAIILLTIFVKLCLHPINVKSLKSMKAMQQLQPQIKELQKKFGSDKQKLNQETMQLFRANKVNPMGGCLPMLVQFPIYIALYKVLWNSIELYHAPFFWFYKDLSAPDPYFVTPILLGLFMVLQQKFTPTTSADPMQQKMMMIMPVMFSVFMLFLPVGLTIYILVNTVMSVTQQAMYNKGIGFMDIIRGKFRTA